MSNILELRGVSYDYNSKTPFATAALRDVSIGFEEGKVTGVIGHTGSGKSTLVQLLNGLLRPSAGQVLLRGKDIWEKPKEISKVRFEVGLVMQYPEYQLFDATVRSDIGFGPRNMKLSDEEIDARVREALAFVGLPEDILEKSPFDLASSHHAHQEIVKGVTLEYSGPFLGLIEIAHFYEIAFFFFLMMAFWHTNVLIGLALALIGLIFMSVLDNSFARLTPNWMLRFMWTVPLSMALANLIWLWVK